jgi:hypothetical protein
MLRPDLSNPTNWNFRAALTKSSPVSGQTFEPILPFEYQNILNQPILLIESICPHAPSNWTSAGTIVQLAPVGFLVGQDEYIDVTSRWLKLGQQLVYFPDLAFPQYKIKFIVPRWIHLITYRIYEYIGDGAASTEGKIDRFYDDYINGV